MFGSGVLDTVIGVMFVFLLVSLLVTTGNELLAAMIRSRAKWLQYGIDRLIGSTWARQLYEHPLIESSTMGLKETTPGKLPWFGNGPSYIPSRTFANILMELLHGADNALRQTEAALLKALELATTGAAAVGDIKVAVDQMATALPAIVPATVAAAIKKDLQQLSAILGRNDAGRLASWLGELEGHTRAITDPTLAGVKTALAALVVDAKGGNLDVAHIRQATIDAIAKLPAGAAGDMTRANLDLVLTRLEAGYSVADAAADVQRFIRGIPAGYVRHLIDDLKDKKMRQALLLLFDDAGNDIEKFKQNIEVWFNNAMDRVGGWYKRRSQWVTGAISLIVVIVMNVDALLIVRYLDANPGMRDGLVRQAQAFVDAKAKEPAPKPEEQAPAKPGTPPAAKPGTPAAKPAAAAAAAAKPAAPAAPKRVVAGDTVTGTLNFAFNKPPEKDVEVVFSTTAPGAVFRPKSVLVKNDATSVAYTLETAISDKTEKFAVTATIPDAVVMPESLDIQQSYPEQLKRIQQQLMELKLPIGWVRNPTQADKDMHLGLPKCLDWGTYWDAMVFHLLGWLITAFAATLGAPFWFDMLNKIMSIRSAGKAPEESPKSPEVVQAPMGPGQTAKEANESAARTRAGAR